jgi:hypothetical protein
MTHLGIFFHQPITLLKMKRFADVLRKSGSCFISLMTHHGRNEYVLILNILADPKNVINTFFFIGTNQIA